MKATAPATRQDANEESAPNCKLPTPGQGVVAEQVRQPSLRDCQRSARCVSSVLICAGHVLLALSALAHANQEVSSAPVTGGEPAAARLSLEAELNSLLRQHGEGAQDANNKQLSEAIISRLMLGNMSESGADLQLLDGAPDESQASDEQQAAVDNLSAPEALRLRKLMSALRNYELVHATHDQFPVLPSGQASTIKRAAAKMGAYLRQQNGRQSPAYARNNFDFGLGKRPDTNLLRLGDSSLGQQLVSSGGLGKRPSAHRYDFGLGKRVASPAYPRYDFGLGKRAPSRVRYDFGLGK